MIIFSFIVEFTKVTSIVATTYSDSNAMTSVIPTNQTKPLPKLITAVSSSTSSSYSSSCTKFRVKDSLEHNNIYRYYLNIFLFVFCVCIYFSYLILCIEQLAVSPKLENKICNVTDQHNNTEASRYTQLHVGQNSSRSLSVCQVFHQQWQQVTQETH